MKKNNIINKNYNSKEKGNKFLLKTSYNNQIHRKLSTYREKQERIMKFIIIKKFFNSKDKKRF